MLVVFSLLGGADKKADAGAGGGDFQFVRALYISFVVVLRKWNSYSVKIL